MAWYRMQPPVLRALLTINTVLFVLWLLVFMHIRVTAVFVLDHLALNPAIRQVIFEPWQLITYNFLHLTPGFWGLLHILFNMLWLVWIGREFEQMHGSHRLLALYLIAGLGGGLLSILWYVVFPAPPGVDVQIYGASASVLGVMTAVAIFYPFKSIALLFIPFPIRLIHLVLAFLALDILFIAGSRTAVAAHLGGALFGFLFARGERGGMDLSSWANVFLSRSGGRSRTRRPAPGPSRVTSIFSRSKWKEGGSAGRGARVTPMPQRDEEDRREPASTEIDRILDKISAQGYEALTSEEKRVLYEASKK